MDVAEDAATISSSQFFIDGVYSTEDSSMNVQFLLRQRPRFDHGGDKISLP